MLITFLLLLHEKSSTKRGNLL